MLTNLVFQNRRSIKNYVSTAVSKKSLYRILEAARWAPSAHNAQPWRFIIIIEEEVKRKLAVAMADEWIRDLKKDNVPPETICSVANASIETFSTAPLLMVVCLTMSEMDEYQDKKRSEAERVMAVQSVAASIQNILLAAHLEGLGSCWFCAPLFCQNTVRKILKIPHRFEPQALITLGYPSEKPKPPPRKKRREIAYKNYWGVKL